MKLATEEYIDNIRRLPSTGQHISASQDEETIVFYQAYNHKIANYAVENGFLGGEAFSYSRMSWIKPNFLWMMYRCGWGSKENQERILALRISKTFFDQILSQAAFSSFNPAVYGSHEIWKEDLAKKEVRLQWDPHHDPAGDKMERRAIQLGLKGDILHEFGTKQLLEVEDITHFVHQQAIFLRDNPQDKLLIPIETLYRPANKELYFNVGITPEMP